MQVDDDKPIAPASDAPADDKSEPEKPEGEEPEGETTETDAATSDEDAGDTSDEDEGDDDEQDDGEGEGDDESQPKRKQSRAQRYRQQRDALRAENEALRSRPSGSPLPSNEQQLVRAIEARVLDEIGPPPKQEDFRDAEGKPDYLRFYNESQAWLNDRRSVTREVKKEFLSALQHEQGRVGELVHSHKERVARLKTQVKDYDEVMSKATMPVAPHVERLILESKRSARIGYHLAKDQGKLARLNNMSPEAVAREIGRIEGRLSLPPTNAKATQARKPVAPLRGGGASPPSNNSARDAWLKKTYGDTLR